MSTALRGPGDRYSVVIEALASGDGVTFSKHRASEGVPFWDVAAKDGAQRREEARGGRPHSYLVVVDEVCSLVLIPGENGLTVRQIKLLNAEQAVITAVVTPGDAAPSWLPEASTYVLFQGDRHDATAFKERYHPLDGMSAERSWTEEGTPLDRLAVAVGRSVARANAALARNTSESGVAMVASVTIRVAVDQTSLDQGRVMVDLARPGSGQTGQFVEFTMTTVPGAAPDESADE